MNKTTKWMLLVGGGLFAYFWWKNRSLHISIPAEGEKPYIPPASDIEYKLQISPDFIPDNEGRVTTGQEYFSDPGVELAKQVWGYSGVPSLNQLRSIGRH